MSPETENALRSLERAATSAALAGANLAAAINALHRQIGQLANDVEKMPADIPPTDRAQP